MIETIQLERHWARISVVPSGPGTWKGCWSVHLSYESAASCPHSEAPVTGKTALFATERLAHEQAEIDARATARSIDALSAD